MPNKQTETPAAAATATPMPIEKLRIIESFSTRLEFNIKRAECVMQDISESYFNMSEEKRSDENYWQLRQGYNNYSIRADIVTDYLFILRKLSEEMTAFFNAEWEAAKKR